MVEEHEVRLKWYDRKGCLALLIFCWPVLLYALWKNRTLSKRTRWIFASVFGALFLFGSIFDTDIELPLEKRKERERQFQALDKLRAPMTKEEDYSIAEKMAALSDLGWLDTGEEAIKRYEYILPQMVNVCSDVPTDSRAADILYVGYKNVKDAGAPGAENLLKYTENAYQIVWKLESSYRKAKMPMKCSELFSLYTIVRRKGQSPGKAVKTVYEGVDVAMRLMEE